VSPRRDGDRLDDILVAINAIDSHLARGGLDDELVRDACRVRVIEIGEAVKAIDSELLRSEPKIPWREIAKMRDHLTHHYFATDHSILEQVVTEELEPLRDATNRLRTRLRGTGPGADS
jgi:uncharacterized protein with HEPN domain